MTPPDRSTATPSALLAVLAAGLLAGFAYPLVEIILECRRPSSEACFWAKEYFVVTLGASLVLIGGATAGAVCLALRRLRRQGAQPLPARVHRPPLAAQAGALAAALAVTLAAAAMGGVASASAGSFYAELSKPGWAPPGAVFGPAWTVLYTMMAVAAWLVWRAAGFPRARSAVALFLVQLAANALWSWLFFAWRLGAAAFAEILVLWVLVAATAVAFWRVHRVAAVLLAPYLAWVSFAAVLSFAIWQRNPEVLG